MGSDSDKRGVRLATAIDIEAASDTLAAAFAAYAWTRWVIPEAGYAAALRELQGLYLRHALEHGIVLVAEGGAGVVALLPPDAPMPEAATLHRIVELHDENISRLSQHASSADAWTLETLGVRPQARGRGVGQALISGALGEARLRGAAAVVLDTSDPRNVALYRRQGFDVVRHSVPAEGPELWAMRAQLTQP